MRPRNRTATALCLLALLLAACQGEATKTLWPEQSDPYYRITREWTRSEELNQGIDVSAKASVTLRSWPWREAYLARRADLYSLPPGEEERLKEREVSAHRAFTEFVVGLSGAEELKNLEDGEVWRVFATQNGKRIYSVVIEDMEEPEWPAKKLAAFFPYYKRWRTFYTLSFPRMEDAPLGLTISGPAGRMDFFWQEYGGGPK